MSTLQEAAAAGTESPLAAVLSDAALAAVHVITPWLRFLGGIPRSVWLSLFGGVSVAYVFVHLLPELAEGQERVSRALGGGAPPALAAVERHVYLVALGGLAVFYGLERMAKRERDARAGGPAPAGASTDPGGESGTSPAVFWVHVGSFGIYNALVGYLLVHRPVTTTGSLVCFAVAMAVHFVVTDHGLNEHHGDRYRRAGRWLLAVAVLVGYGPGRLAEVAEAALAVLVAFLAGGVILNVFKEEVPAERQSRFWAFALGAAGYAGLLLAA